MGATQGNGGYCFCSSPHHMTRSLRVPGLRPPWLNLFWFCEALRCYNPLWRRSQRCCGNTASNKLHRSRHARGRMQCVGMELAPLRLIPWHHEFLSRNSKTQTKTSYSQFTRSTWDGFPCSTSCHALSIPFQGKDASQNFHIHARTLSIVNKEYQGIVYWNLGCFIGF